MGLRNLLDRIYAPHYGKWAVTLRGEVVRSSSERRIANYLVLHGIKYKYEKTLRTFPIFGHKISNPDFYLPTYKVYVEYWGFPDNRKYKEDMEWKLHQYEIHGVRVISLFYEDLKQIEKSFPLRFKEAMGFDLFAQYKPRWRSASDLPRLTK